MQWLQSKIVMLVVGVILISSIVGVFQYRLDQMEEEERYNRCRKISQVVGEMYNSDVDEMRQRLTFDEDSKGVYLSPTIRDKGYVIEIWIDLVRVKNEGGVSSKRLQESVHLWSPRQRNDTDVLKERERQWRDRKEPYLELEAGSNDLEMTMLRLHDGSRTRLHLFVSEVEPL